METGTGDPAFVHWFIKHQATLFSPGTHSENDMEMPADFDRHLPLGSRDYPATSGGVAPANRRGFIELTSKCSVEMRRRLISAAHDASQEGSVVLVLNGVSTQAVRGFIDAVSRLKGIPSGNIRLLSVCGIDENLLSEAAEADFVIAQSSALSAALFTRGTRYMAVARGLRFLQSGPFQRDSSVAGLRAM